MPQPITLTRGKHTLHVDSDNTAGASETITAILLTPQQEPDFEKILRDRSIVSDSFKELLDTTAWDDYGTASGNPKCRDCMVHSGYEASAVNDTFSSLRGLMATAKATLFTRYKDPAALAMLNQPSKPVHAYGPLVQLRAADTPLEKVRS